MSWVPQSYEKPSENCSPNCRKSVPSTSRNRVLIARTIHSRTKLEEFRPLIRGSSPIRANAFRRRFMKDARRRRTTAQHTSRHRQAVSGMSASDPERTCRYPRHNLDTDPFELLNTRVPLIPVQAAAPCEALRPLLGAFESFTFFPIPACRL